MKFYEFIPLTAALVNTLLTGFILSQNYRSGLARVYALWGGSITVWNFGTYFMFHVSTAEEAYFWARVLQLGVIFLPPSLFHLCAMLAHVDVRKVMWAVYAIHVGLAVTLLQGEFVVGVRRFHYAFYSVAGPWFWVFLAVYALSSSATMGMLFWRQRVMPPLRRARLRWLIAANGILIVFGANDILPILGWDFYPLTRVQIFPFGSAAAIFYGIIVGYSVLQHQLLDIYVSFSKVAAHLVRFLFLFLLSIGLLLLLTVFAPEQFTLFSFVAAILVLLVSAVIASVIFPRLFGAGDEAVERRILGDRFEYHDKIQGFVQAIPGYSETNVLMQDLSDLLVKTVQVKSYHIILRDETSRKLNLFWSHPEAELGRLRVAPDSPVFQWIERSRREPWLFRLGQQAGNGTVEELRLREELSQFGAEFCFPFLAGDEAFGLLLVGEKTSGDPFTPQDLRLLTALVKNLSLVINQIRLQKQILQAQELDLLGRMSRGMAHDLNNLLTPVWTVLQLAADKGEDREKVLELLPMAQRNVGTMQAYIREALFFSETKSPDFRLCGVRNLLEKAVALVESAGQKREIEIQVDTPSDLMLEVDETLAQRLLGNLFSNSLDASPPGSRVFVSAEAVGKTEAGGWVRIRVVDYGEGISRENLRRISSPYFTTKDRGDERRGFGLGLAICRKIVHLHSGKLNIESSEKRGTTVQIDLPARQPRVVAQA